MITQKHIKNLFLYNRKTGLFCWKVKRLGCVREVAGCANKDGYIIIGVDGKL